MQQFKCVHYHDRQGWDVRYRYYISISDDMYATLKAKYTDKMYYHDAAYRDALSFVSEDSKLDAIVMRYGSSSSHFESNIVAMPGQYYIVAQDEESAKAFHKWLYPPPPADPLAVFEIWD